MVKANKNSTVEGNGDETVKTTVRIPKELVVRLNQARAVRVGLGLSDAIVEAIAAWVLASAKGTGTIPVLNSEQPALKSGHVLSSTELSLSTKERESVRQLLAILNGKDREVASWFQRGLREVSRLVGGDGIGHNDPGKAGKREDGRAAKALRLAKKLKQEEEENRRDQKGPTGTDR